MNIIFQLFTFPGGAWFTRRTVKHYATHHTPYWIYRVISPTGLAATTHDLSHALGYFKWGFCVISTAPNGETWYTDPNVKGAEIVYRRDDNG